MRDSQRQKVYETERAALDGMGSDYFAPLPTFTGPGSHRLDQWEAWRPQALRTLRTEAAHLTTTEWWQTVTGLDLPGARPERCTRIRIAPKTARASRGGRYQNAYGISMLATMLQYRTLVHELAHVAYYAMTRDTIAAYYPGAPVGSRPRPADPGHGPIWRGLYVEALTAYGRPEEGAALRDAFEAARLAVTACPIKATPPALTVEPARFAVAAEPRRIEPARLVEPLTLF